MFYRLELTMTVIQALIHEAFRNSIHPPADVCLKQNSFDTNRKLAVSLSLQGF